MSSAESYNQRQYKIMLDRMEDYHKGRLSLSRLISDLEALIWYLQEVSDDWRNSLLSRWGVLEDIYSVGVVEGRAELSSEDLFLITKAIKELKELIRPLVTGETLEVAHNTQDRYLCHVKRPLREQATGDEIREQLSLPAVLLIEVKAEGVFLYRFADDGSVVGDTWHTSVDEAKHQAQFEYDKFLSDWEIVPPNVTDVVAFALGRLK